MNTLAELARGALSLLAPLRCAGCDLPLRPLESGFCSGCEPLIERAHPAFAPPSLSAAGFVYGGPLAVAVQSLKYRRRTELAPVLAQRLSHIAGAYLGHVDVVMPMPLHPAKLRARGFNQAALLAAPVAAALQLPLDVRSLRRVRLTRDQAGLPRAERTHNPAGAFSATVPANGRRVLLIDDVRTTGATLAAAAAALLEVGHPLVMTLALARTEL